MNFILKSIKSPVFKSKTIYTTEKTYNKFTDTYYNNVDFDTLFDNIKNEDLLFLKINRKLNRFFEEHSKKRNYNDTMWCVYNDLKLEYEAKYDYNSMCSVLEKMGRLLFFEHKYYECINYIYAYTYCKLYLRVDMNKTSLGECNKKDLINIFKHTHSKLCKEKLKEAIDTLIPSFYDKNVLDKVYIIIKKALDA